MRAYSTPDSSQIKLQSKTFNVEWHDKIECFQTMNYMLICRAGLSENWVFTNWAFGMGLEPHVNQAM